jgi:hypothetical protein
MNGGSKRGVRAQKTQQAVVQKAGSGRPHKWKDLLAPPCVNNRNTRIYPWGTPCFTGPQREKIFIQQGPKVQRGSRGVAPLLLNLGAMRGGWSAIRLGRFTPGKTRYPLYRRLGWSQGRSGRRRKFSPHRIRSRTVQPVVSRYTDWAIPVNKIVV